VFLFKINIFHSMVESKLESLIQRLESAVARQEALIGEHSSIAPAAPAQAS
jgi:hypothetical protein